MILNEITNKNHLFLDLFFVMRHSGMSPTSFQTAFAILPAFESHRIYDFCSPTDAFAVQARILENQDCRINRDLIDYANRNPHLIPTIDNLTPNDHWLDAGAGLALPMRELARSRRSLFARFRGKRPPQITALSLKKPTCKKLEEDLRRFPEFRYVEQDILASDGQALPPAHLITDIKGPLSYACDLRALLMQYGALLTHGGELHAKIQLGFMMYQRVGIGIESEDFSQTFFPNLIIQTASGNQITFLDFLKMTTGFQLLHYDLDKRGEDSYDATVVLLRTDEPVRVPALRFLDDRFVPHTPPRRVYQLDPQQA